MKISLFFKGDKNMEELFSAIIECGGTEASNVNDEYSLDPNDTFYTDGISNISLIKAQDKKGDFAYIVLAIRGATYLIVKDKHGLILYINKQYKESKKEEIINKVKLIQDSNDDMDYYLKSWRGEYFVQNEIRAEDLL